MFYVLFECSTVYSEEAPKDHTMIASISYQIVSVEDLEPIWQEPRKITVEAGLPLQKVIQHFESDVKSRINVFQDQYVLCSLYSTWHLRVTLPRQARDESWLLPTFLQHPKVFDLWREVDRWLCNHPGVRDAIKGKDNAERNVTKNTYNLVRFFNCDANQDTCMVKSEQNTTSVTQVDFESEHPIEQSRTLIVALHEKCLSEQDESSVLTHPYDSYLDITKFIQEKSKVLYMNNLPPDTTQSELESWFTQFGSRPMSFWTVKNVVEETSNVNNNWTTNNNLYVDEQDSISGFVVYQTHEEALDSLVLNGRSILSNMSNTKQPRVVEHVVEIQPSSDLLLEKTQDILSPFPQSKNKPRPGDWTCPSCGFSNFQRRTACFRCSFPIPIDAQLKNHKTAANTQVSANHTTVGNPNVKSRSATSTPHTSDYNNSIQSQQQQILLLNSLSNHLSAASVQDLSQKLELHHRMSHNGGNRSQLQQPVNLVPNGSNVPFRAGDWKCTSCWYHNFAKNAVCLRCGGPKTSTSGPKLANYENNSTPAVIVPSTDTYNGSATNSATIHMQQRRSDLYLQTHVQPQVQAQTQPQALSQAFSTIAMPADPRPDHAWMPAPTKIV